MSSKEFKEELIAEEEKVETPAEESVKEEPVKEPKEVAEKPKAKPKAEAPKPTKKEEEMVEFCLSVPEGGPEFEFVSVNERTFQIKTNEYIKMPRCVVELLKNSHRQVVEARNKRNQAKDVEIASM